MSDEASPPGSRNGWQTRLIFVAFLMGVGALGWWLVQREWLSAAELVRQGEAALQRRNHQAAAALAARALSIAPSSTQGLLLQARATQQAGRMRDALKLFEQIPDDGSAAAVEARCDAGDLALFQLHRLTEAESLFRRALQQDPHSLTAHNRLAYVLGLQSRNVEAAPHRLAVLRSGTFTATDLYLISLGDRAMDDPQAIAEYFRESDTDLGARLAWARVLAEQGEAARAESLFQSLLDSRDHAAEALSRWGAMLIAVGNQQGLSTWDAAAHSAETHPGVWFVRGVCASERGEPKSAARCFGEAVRRDPEHATANYRLGQVLVTLERRPDAEPFLERAQRLEAFARAAELAYRVGGADDLRKARESAERAGLIPEAWAWSRLLSDMPLASADDTGAMDRLESLLPEGEWSRSVPSRNPALRLDLSSWPGDHAQKRRSVGPTFRSDKSPRSDIAFEDSAASAGIEFQYVNGGNPRRGLVKMYEVVGGGVAAFDFDRDDWPDLYFPQGGDWALQNRRLETDRLFRNLGEGRFADVTAKARIVETGFSQGVSVGDYDADGFPDLYIANIGNDCLLRNQGDGTFIDATAQAEVDDDDYSASAAIADFSGDGLPDIYVVNYLSGDDLWDRVCGGADGIPRSCLPQSFDAAKDRFLLNQGDGRFEDRTHESGVSELAGKGLGVIAADFDGSGRLGLYIVNDVGPNFLLQNVASQEHSVPRFADVGVVSGTALSGQGRFQSGMGAAAGDLDGNGMLDLFVTNFEGESNTLYLQVGELQFQDDTSRCGLAGPRFDLVGWGTQFLDADLDGWLDVAVTNGHINNLEDHNKPYRMPAFVYRNAGEGRMSPVESKRLGAYFEGEYLGRGMARGDWNRDGLDDLVITHLDASAALLVNRSETPGHGIGLRLTGTKSERDAIGAIVRVDTGTRILVRHLTAGDGNQSNNERRLVFGLGIDAGIRNVTVQWPGGATQELGSLAIDADYRVIEGAPRAYQVSDWPRSQIQP